jgi:uncharacterized Ntn-hydrolase superfamily protein
MTFSIVAYEPQTRELGGAVASFTFGAGSLVLWARPGAGVVITQMTPEANYAASGLNRMEAGEAADAVLSSLLKIDAGVGQRQLAMLDPRGKVAAYTGAQCVGYAGHRAAAGISAQGAMLLNTGVWNEMYDAFESAKGSLAERLIAALERGLQLGGDIRGHRAAALAVVRAEASDRPWRDRTVDLRIDDHDEPIRELRRLQVLNQLYSASNNAFEAALSGDMAGGLAKFAELEKDNPEDPDIALRQGILLALTGDIPYARRRFDACYRASDAWREVVRRLAVAGFIPDDPRLL